MGVHQYAYHILWGLYNLRKNSSNNHQYIIYLNQSPRKDLPKQEKFWKYEVIEGSKLWVLTKLMPALIKNKDLDLFFAPSHYLPPLPLRLSKVCTIHDLGYLRFSEQFKFCDFWQLKLWTAISISISKCVIAVSKFTKRDIVRHYPFASRKVAVVYHGYEKERFNNKICQDVVRRSRAKYHIPNSVNYILFLSTLKPSKNVENLLEAFLKLKDEFSNLMLVIAGGKGWLYESIFEKVKKLEIERSVIFTGYVAEEYKPALLKGAKVFVSPSFWEGFGMHVLEAMACGIPVVVSPTASLPEVVGDAGIYIDPKSVEDISMGIRKVLNLKKRGYNKLVEKTLKQAENFDWEKTAKETMKVLEKLA
jgi:glycosyltransferase involved in cell wall biosynthesis